MPRLHWTGFLLGSCLAAVLPSDARAGRSFPPFSYSDTEVRDLPASANGRQYRLLVALPASFASEPARKYPVLFLCDGYWDFGLVRGFLGNLRYDEAIPEILVVGLSYVGDNPDYDALRMLDLSPVPDRDDPQGKRSGHGGGFLQVLESQIIPFVEEEYRADPAYRVIGGSSLGGLFVLYAAQERPGLFRGVIAPSPAVQFGDGYLFERERLRHEQRTPWPVRLYLSAAGEEWPEFRDGVIRYHDLLANNRPPKLELAWRLVQGERHAGTKAESFNRGLRFVFAPLAPKPAVDKP